MLCARGSCAVGVLHRGLAQQATHSARTTPNPTFDTRTRTANKAVNEEALADADAPPKEMGEFRRLRIWQLTETGDDPSVHKKKREAGEVTQEEEEFRETHRWKKMSTTQDWPSIWPTAMTFKPATVPLPIRMGYRENPMKKPPPEKYWNKELMKIPNFLHLTPPAVDRHCDAIKQFCTPWPEGLDTEAAVSTHYPLTMTTVDRMHSGPSIRDRRSRNVTMSVHLDHLPLHDTHAREKFIRLVGADRYDKRSNMVTMTADRCPTRDQNWEYLQYLLTVLCGESNETEAWESGITREDSLSYEFAASDGCARWTGWVRQWLRRNPDDRPKWLRDVDANLSDDDIKQLPQMVQLSGVWEKATNADKNSTTDIELMDMWGHVNDASIKMMGLKPFDDLR